MPETLPELLRDVRRIRLDQRDRGLGGEPRVRSTRIPAELVDQLHHGRDRRVELKAAAYVVGDLRDRRVSLAGQRSIGQVLAWSGGRRLVDDPPQAAEEARDSLDSLFRPLHVLVGRTHEEDVRANGVGAVRLDQLIRPRDVPARLRHLRPSLPHPPLVEEPGKRLSEPDQAELVHDLDEEAGIEQVPGRVIDSADVLVDRHPVVDDRAVERRLIVVRVAVTQEVPGRVDERVHRVGFTAANRPATRARYEQPLLVRGERRLALRLVVVDLRQEDGQVLVRDGHRSAVVAIDDRDRAAPVALARERPVPQPVADRRAPAAVRPQPVDDPGCSLGRRQSAELARVDEPLALGVRGEGAFRLVGAAVGGLDDAHHRQPVPLRKREVTLVVGGHGHDRAGAVLHQHVVRDPDRDRLAGRRVDGVASGEDAVLLLRLALFGRPARRVPHVLADVRFALRSGRQPLDERMLRGEDEECCAEQGVRSGGEDGQVEVEVFDAEDHLGPFRATDPVLLDRDRAVGPVELVVIVEQRVGVGSDPEEPLLHVAGLDRGAATLAAAVDHVLVRDDRLVFRAPVDRRFLPVGVAGLVEAKEQPLSPAVVLGLMGRRLAIPIDRPAQTPHLRADVLDVSLDDVAGVAPLTDRGVLGG